MLTALLLTQSGIAFVIQMLNVGSAALFFLSALPIFLALAFNPFFTGGKKEISLMTYIIGKPFPLLTGTLLMAPVLEVFVPLVSHLSI